MSQTDTDVLCPPTPQPGWEHVDPATWKIIQQLFPEQTRGQLFFTRFLERATQERSILPDAPTTVYICTKSIAALGRELGGFSNDTTQKYVALFLALGLLTKRKFMDRIAFILHMGEYQAPETLEANLEYLIQHSRPRLRAMAIEVQARCKLYGLISQDFVSALSHLNSFLATTKGNKRTLEQHMMQAQVLTSGLLAELVAGRLQVRSSWGDSGSDKSSSQEYKTGRLNPEEPNTNLPRPTYQEDSILKKMQGESPHTNLLGRLDLETPIEDLPKSPSWRDSTPKEGSHESPSERYLERLDSEVPNTNLPKGANQGDSDQKPLLEVQEDDFATYNVTYIINTITSNVQRKRIAQFFGKVLEEDVTVFAKYLKLFNEFSPEIIGRAYLSTMVLVHHAHWSIDRPGAFFTSQCRALSGQTPLKKYTHEDVEAWSQKWGNLPYPELLKALDPPPSPRMPQKTHSHPAGTLLSKGSSAKSSFSNKSGGSQYKKRTYGMHYTGRPSGRYSSAVGSSQASH